MQEFDEKRYRKELKIISITKANMLGLFSVIPVILIFGGFFILFHGFPSKEAWFDFSTGNFVLDIVFLIAVFLLGIVLHELIHGITWALFTKNGFRSIRFGVLWKYLTPYCHCKEPLKVKQYLLGAITPAIFVGFVPAITGLLIASVPVMIYGMLFIVAAIGDFMIIHLLIKEDMNSYVQDHPSEAGCYIYREIST